MAGNAVCFKNSAANTAGDSPKYNPRKKPGIQIDNADRGRPRISMLRVEEILGAALAKEARCVDHQNLPLPLGGLGAAHDYHGGREAGAV
ncbi:MAG: hypothetical protein L0209_06435, partial [candidate division Zixibacteria bacterium]|nr:hypothetical protein [candidate division Zixibacteria bacterium]